MGQIAIHGFGRIGRTLLRIALERNLFTPKAVSDIKDLSIGEDGSWLLLSNIAA